MRPQPWMPKVEMTTREMVLLNRFKKRPFFGFLRRHRHTILDEAFQAELATMYREDTHEGGRAPVSPALLALVTLLQAYTGVSDADAVELALVDVRWRVVLGLLDVSEAGSVPFSQGTLVAFRNRLVAHGLDRRLLERTIALAKETGEFGYKPLRLALDASPLFSAGRVEDTFNLLGRATREVIFAAAAHFGVIVEEVVTGAKLSLLVADVLVGAGSLKARLDVEWERPEARQAAFDRLVQEVLALKAYLEARTSLATGPLAPHWAVVEEVLGQDVEPDPDAGAGHYRLRRGTAPDRRPSVMDGEARHGRKTRMQKFVGYKRHLAIDLDTGLVLAVGLAPANVPEGAITEEVAADLARQLAPEAVSPLPAVASVVRSVHVDRAYLGSALVSEARKAGAAIFCKPFPQRGRPGMFTKAAFALSLVEGTLTCPAGQQVKAIAGETSRFSASVCQACPLRSQCTSAVAGRSVHIHPDEAFFQELRERQRTSEGRAALRERVAIEHVLAREIQIQGRKARYKGKRKNLLALRLGACIVNLQTVDRILRLKRAAQPPRRVS